MLLGFIKSNMYSHELQEFISIRNFRLGGDDLLKAISIEENPQLNHISYNPYDNHYTMWDNEGNNFNFEAMPYEESIEKGLVKCKKIMK